MEGPLIIYAFFPVTTEWLKSQLQTSNLALMTTTLALDLPSDVLASARMTLAEMRTELAIALFRLDRLSMGKAAELAALPVGIFQSQLAARGIGPHYEVADALDDAAALAALSPLPRS